MGHAWLGVMLDEDGVGKRGDSPGTSRGARVVRVMPNSPAERAGMKDGDVIVSLDGKSVSSPAALRELLHDGRAGQAVRIEVIRDGKKETLTATLSQFAMLDLPQEFFKGGQPGQFFEFAAPQRARLGVSLVPLTEQLRDYFGVESGVGVLVSSVEADSAASRAGLKAGDVLTAVGANRVASARDVVEELRKLETGTHTLDLTLVRDRVRQNVAVTVEVPEKRDEPTPGHVRT